MRIGLANGVWYNAGSGILTSLSGIVAAGATSSLSFYLGLAGLALGIGLFVWGITWNGRPWWKMGLPEEDVMKDRSNLLSSSAYVPVKTGPASFMHNCKSVGSGAHGFNVGAGAKVVITDCEAVDSGKDGFHVEGSEDQQR